MEKIVEGEWNGFTFRRALPSDEEALALFMRHHYFPHEPLTILMGFSEEHERDIRNLWTTFFDHQLSFLATDNESGEIAGVRFIFNHKKDMDWSKFDFRSPQTACLLKLMDKLDANNNFFEQYKIENYAHFCYTAVHEQFRRRGLVTEMYNRAIRLCRDQGFFLATTCFSNPFSRKAGAKAGLVERSRINVMDVKDQNGEQVIANATAEHIFSRAVYIL